jgi:hypothetical protein
MRGVSTSNDGTFAHTTLNHQLFFNIVVVCITHNHKHTQYRKPNQYCQWPSNQKKQYPKRKEKDTTIYSYNTPLPLDVKMRTHPII